jgi:hypothetical protein
MKNFPRLAMLKQSAFCREKPDLGGFQGFFEEYVPVFLVCVETYLHRGGTFIVWY